MTEELYSLLVPLHKDRLIVPRSCVAEVIRYAPPEEITGAPPWFRGVIDWSGRRVPLVCFEALCGRPSTDAGGRTRIAIFHGMSGLLESESFGLLTEGFPQLVRVNRDVMERDDQHSWPEDGPVICQIRMINEYPLIPDLEKLESLIHDQVSQGQVVT